MNGGDVQAGNLRRLLADRLLGELTTSTLGSWHWYESVLAYDNARLPQAMIVTGLATGNSAYTQAGLTSLRWLMRHQTSPSGCFRPVGSASFGKIRQPPDSFDQQPVEVTATIAACRAAACADSGGAWSAEAKRAFDWFLGANDLQVPIVDIATGGCLDGLHPDRPNRNMGAESVLSYLLALIEIRQMAPAAAVHRRDNGAPQIALSA